MSKYEPVLWRKQYDNIIIMRQNYDAAIDTKGCEARYLSYSHLPPKEKRFSILISIMLSSQTKDELVSSVMEAIHKKFQPFNPEVVINMPTDKLEDLIRQIRFYKRKAGYMKNIAKILKGRYDCDIPDNFDGLCELPGIGSVMAYSIMSLVWNKKLGFIVDSNVQRVTNRLGWTEAKTLENCRKQIEEWLPNDYWDEAAKILAGFGQQICKTMNPKCSECLNNQICPYAKLRNKK